MGKTGGASEIVSVVGNVSEDTIIDQIEEAARASAFVIVDLEGTASVMPSYATSRADLVLIPTQGSHLDAAESAKAIKLVRGREKAFGRKIPFTILFTRTSVAIRTKTFQAIEDEFASNKYSDAQIPYSRARGISCDLFLWRNASNADSRASKGNQRGGEFPEPRGSKAKDGRAGSTQAAPASYRAQVQFNAKASQTTIDRFYALCDLKGWVLGYTLERAVDALEREPKAKPVGAIFRFLGNGTLDSITPLSLEEFQQGRGQEVSPATVNRETALLKHMFNMVERWRLYQGTNPVRLVKFLPEDNLQFRTLGADEEQRLLQFAPPYLRELILFAVNTGLRCGDVLTLKWEDVDIEENRLSIIMGKTRRRLEVPLNETAMEIPPRRQPCNTMSLPHGP